jgi:peptidoglycan glycosyltransferase
MACLLLFGLLILNVNWVQVVKADDYRDDPRNSRVLLRTYERERGPIAVLDARASASRSRVGPHRRTARVAAHLPGGAAYARSPATTPSSTAAPDRARAGRGAVR